MIIATKTLRRNKPGTNKLDFEIIKGQEVKASIYRKLNRADRATYTRRDDKDASINRRIAGRQTALDQLGYFSDVNLEVLKYLSATHTNRELLDKRSGQNGMIKGLERRVFEYFNLDDRRIELQHTDDFKQGIEATVWIAWPISEDEAESIQAFLASL